MTPLDAGRARLAEAYLPAAFAVAAGFIRSRPHLRAELEEETWYAAVKAAQRWRGDPAGGSRFAYFMKVTTRRFLLSYLRARKRPKHLPADRLPPDLASRRPDPAAALDAADQVEDLLRRIRPRERQILTLLYLDGLTYAEASEAAGVDPSKLHRLAASGLQALRQWARAGPHHPGKIRRG